MSSQDYVNILGLILLSAMILAPVIALTGFFVYVCLELWEAGASKGYLPAIPKRYHTRRVLPQHRDERE